MVVFVDIDRGVFADGGVGNVLGLAVACLYGRR